MKIRSIFTLLPLLCFLLGTNLLSAKKLIIIDAGHGGKDVGGAHGKVYEKHLALDTAYRLNTYLKRKGFRTLMTRDSDHFVSLSKRAQVSNRYRDAIFVSVHYNATHKKSVSGLETFYYSSQSRALAQYVQDKMMNQVSAVDRGVKFGKYYVLRKNRNPSILVELGFVSNRKERERMKKGRYRDVLAKAIASGISKYDARY